MVDSYNLPPAAPWIATCPLLHPAFIIVPDGWRVPPLHRLPPIWFALLKYPPPSVWFEANGIIRVAGYGAPPRRERRVRRVRARRERFVCLQRRELFLILPDIKKVIFYILLYILQIYYFIINLVFWLCNIWLLNTQYLSRTSLPTGNRGFPSSVNSW